MSQSLALPTLVSAGVSLRFEHVIPGQLLRGLSPQLHFKILDPQTTTVGHLNFRLGDSPHVRMTAGHIGYSIDEAHRGHRYALHACRAIAPVVRLYYDVVILTVEVGNVASRRTIEILGARYLGEYVVPQDDPGYASGGRRRLRYEWQP